MVTVGFQIILLVLVVVLTIPFVTEVYVEKRVSVTDVYSSSWFELVKLVACIWGRAKQALKEGRLFVYGRRRVTIPVSGLSVRSQCGGKWGMPLCPLS